MRKAWFLLAAAGLFPALLSCSRVGCLGGDDATCRVPSPCGNLSFTCTGGRAEARVLVPGDTVPGGPDALGAPGDVLLGNERVVAVIDALANANYLAPSGGNLLDLGTRTGGANDDDDGVNQVLTAVGILPGDEVRWTDLQILDPGPEIAAVQVRGFLDGRLHVKVAQRYEVRRCEPGIRIRTEAVNLGEDPELWALFDGYWWGGREALPFTPVRGEGFRHDDFSLLTIDAAFQAYPWFAWTAHAPGTGAVPVASYATVACNVPALSGFNSETISAAGLAKRIVLPGDYAVYERFIAVAPKGDVAGGADLAQSVREKLFGERAVTLSGTVVRTGGPPVGGAEHRAAVIAREIPRPDAPESEATPRSEAVPDAQGKFAMRLPGGRRYRLDVEAFGQQVARAEVDVGSADLDAGMLSVPLVGSIAVAVVDGAGNALDARVVLVPADAATAAATTGKLFGSFDACTPLLGPPHGGSPACNQVLVRGATVFEAPSGHYFVYASAGPFWTLQRREVSVEASPTPIPVFFQLDPIRGLQPAGTISADLHVHGQASFDSSIPDLDRALAFAAARIDVIAATDHDVVGNYDLALGALGLRDRIAVMSGVETTGQIPWFTRPGETIPRVIGHWNFWPVKYDAALPRRGAPEDERLEPGALFERVRPLMTGRGVVELNHPWAPPEFGRDLGYPRALGLDLHHALPDHDDGTAHGMFVRVPHGAHTANDAFDAQEVMNGSRNEMHLAYRAFWFYLLDQGKVRAGTANSDSHGLTDSVLGTPRNLVWAATQPGPGFDAEVLDSAVRDGHLLGTNGPVIEAEVVSGTAHVRPSVVPFTPAADAQLAITVTAAPWIPVSQVRVVVNGDVARTLPGLPAADHFGAAPVTASYTVPVASILPAGTRDAWIVVEAGEPLPLAADLDGDGVPDTGDNNGDGRVDRADVAAGETVGPLHAPPPPSDPADPRFDFASVSTGGVPQAFTNPFLLDRDGNPGFQGPGLTGGTP